MIAHRIKKVSGTNKFGKLASYVLDAEKSKALDRFEVLARYVADVNGRGSGERVVGARITNIPTDNMYEAIAYIEATQAMNRRSEAEKSYHLVISFPQGERPSLEQLIDIEDTLCAAIGYGDHQRISAIHDDTDCLHVHVAINKIHPKTLRNFEMKGDFNQLMSACLQLEQKHELVRTNHGTYDRGPIPHGASKMEAYAMRESLQTWVTTFIPELEAIAAAATNWSDLQKGLAEYDLEIRARGAGLVISKIGEGISIKASSVSPDLAFKALTDRFGPLEKRFDQEQQTEKGQGQKKASYDRRPRQRAEETKALYERFLLVSNQAKADRQSALDKNKADWEKYDRDLRSNHQLRYEVIQKNSYDLEPSGKKRAIEKLKLERLAEWSSRKVLAAQQRKAILAHYTVPAWQPWLQEQAQNGDQAAVTALRSSALYRNKLGADILWAADIEAARNVVLNETHFKGREAPPIKVQPTAARNGDLVYRLKDGGRVTDTAGEIRCDLVSVHAAFMVLALALEKFPDQPVEIRGSDEFKAAIIMVSALPGWNLTFSDPQMERDRTIACEARVIARQDDGAAQYVAARNAARASGIDVSPHRLWTAADAGNAYFAGRRRFSDGTEAILIGKNGETLVRPASQAQMAKASTWRIGLAIVIDGQGRVITSVERGYERDGR